MIRSNDWSMRPRRRLTRFMLRDFSWQCVTIIAPPFIAAQFTDRMRFSRTYRRRNQAGNYQRISRRKLECERR